MAYDNSLFPGGPAYFTRNSVSYQAYEDSWGIKDDNKNFDVTTNLQGRVGSRIEDVMARISLKPIITTTNLAAMLAALIPWRPSHRGNLVFGATDVTGVVQTKNGGTSDLGQSVTYTKTGLTKMAALTLAPNKALVSGDPEWTALIKSGASGASAADFRAVASSTYSEPTLSPLAFYFDTYTLAIGASPAAPLDQVIVDDSGIVVTPVVTLEPIITSTFGTVNYRIKAVELEIKFRPVNLTIGNYATLFPAEGTGIKRGAPRRSVGSAVSILGNMGTGGLTLQVPNMFVKEGGLVFDSTKSRVEEITLQAERTDSAGVLADLFTLGVQ